MRHPKRRRNLLRRGMAGLLLGGLLVQTAGVVSALAKAPSIGDLPVQHEGRIKPVDTVAGVHLLSSYGRRSLREIGPAAWWAEVVLDAEAADERRFFRIRNPEVVAALELPERAKGKYTFPEVRDALIPQEANLRVLHSRERAERTLVETQLVELHMAALRYRGLGGAMSCLVRQFALEDSTLAAEFELLVGEMASYRHFALRRPVFQHALERLEATPEEEWTAADLELDRLARRLGQVRMEAGNASLAIIPPQEGTGSREWVAPWDLLDGREPAPLQLSVMDGWEEVLAARAAGDLDRESALVTDLLAVVGTGEDGLPEQRLLRLEAWSNSAGIFPKSTSFYVLSFLLLAVSWLGKTHLLRRLAMVSLGLAVGIHTGGLLLRMIIMGRPPVSTLYESVVFVGLVAGLTGMIVEWLRKDGLGLFVGSILGALLHFVGFGYAADGDTLGMLVAVLNSNFWLATHVVTITIGYGCSVVAGLAGHVYLVRRIARRGDREEMAGLVRSLTGLTLVALFFTLLGTILGGIWADQSWGRFWGWDPKENGALLIVMWQLLLLHGRLSGHFKPAGFAAGLVFGNVIVAMAWFGVNLLNVGLHTYGFTESIAVNLGIFCGFEVLFILIGLPWARSRPDYS